MTTESPAAPARVPAVPAAGSHTLAGNLLSAGWTKVRSGRSTVWTLTLFVVLTLGLTALFTWLTVSNCNRPHAADRGPRVVLAPVRFNPGSGLARRQLA